MVFGLDVNASSFSLLGILIPLVSCRGILSLVFAVSGLLQSISFIIPVQRALSAEMTDI